MNTLIYLSNLRGYISIVCLFVALIFLIGCGKTGNAESQIDSPYVVAANQIEAGRYIAIIGGCNDCHTEGYLQTEGKIPEEDWFAGSRLGWQGPWGTTYPPNLRLRVQEMTEEEWVLVVHERTDLPPMPWMNVNQMSEKDAKALYHYLKSLGPKGEHSPDALDPGVEPETPYLSLVPKNLPH
jgi:mono/diheme cytochrome c family protein